MGLFDTIRDAVGGSAEPEAEPDDDGAGESDTGNTMDGPEPVEVRSLGPTTFRQQAETVVETADPLSFSPESLSRLDTAIAEQYEGHEPVTADGVYTERATKLGSYLGEVLVREYGGEWTRDDGWGVTVTGTNGEVTVAVFEVAAHSLTEQPVFETVPERLEAKLRFESESERPKTDDPAATADAESDDTGSDSSPATSPDSEPTRIVRPVSTTADEQPAATDTEQDPGRVGDPGSTADGDAAETTAEADPTRVVHRIEEPDEPTRVVQPVADAAPAEPAGDDTDEPGPPADDTAPTRVVRRIEEPDETGPPTDEPTRVVRRVDDGSPETGERPDEATAATEPPVEPTRVVRRVETETGDTAPTRVVRRVAEAEANSASQAAPPADETEAERPGTDPSPPEPTRVVRRVEQPTEDDGAPTRVVRPVEDTGEGGTADEDSPATDDGEPTRVVRRVVADETATRAGTSPPGSTTAETPEATADETPPGSAATGATDPTDGTREPPGTGPADQPGRSAGTTDDGGNEDGGDAVVEDTGAATETGGTVDGEGDPTSDPTAGMGTGTADPGPTSDSPGGRDPATFRGLRAEYAERAVDFTEFWSERDLDFSRDSLDRLDALVGDQWADERFDDATFDSDGDFDDRVFASVATELGSYFGEVLVRTLDGEWTDGTDHEAAVVVDGPAGPLAVPVFQVATNSLRETAVFARSYDALVADLGREP